MNFSNYWIEEAKNKLGTNYDRDVINKITGSKGFFSDIRNEKATLSKTQAVEIASILKVDAGVILAGIMADKTHDPDEKRAWVKLIEKAEPEHFKKLERVVKSILC